MHIATNILYLRENLKLSQENFGKIFGLNRGNISSYESGTVPPVSILIKIASHFKLTVEQLALEDFSTTPPSFGNLKSPVAYSLPKKPSVIAEAPTRYEQKLEAEVAALKDVIKAKDETIEKLNELAQALERTVKLLEGKS